MDKIQVKVCLGATCFVMGSANLQELTKIIPEKYGDRVDVFGAPCHGLCSQDYELSKAPYVRVNSKVINEATVDKVLATIDSILVSKE